MSYLLDPSHWSLSTTDNIPSLILVHTYLTLVSVGIGLLIAFPIALLISRTPANAPIFDPARLYAPVIGVAGFLYTIPSLAFVAFLVPFTGLWSATSSFRWLPIARLY